MRDLAIVGGGPIGLEAAAAAVEAGWRVKLYERRAVGSSVASWGHVRLFTPWAMNTTELGARLAREAGAKEVDPARFPTGTELAERYLLPLASHPSLAKSIEIASVVGIGREGFLKHEMVDERRTAPFRLLVERAGAVEVRHADAVIDASGTFTTPRWLGAAGLPAPGEREHGDLITRHLPDLHGRDRAAYEGARVLVVGAGTSAATAVRDLAWLDGAQVVWAVRGQQISPLAGLPKDPLPERARLVREANALALGGSQRVKLLTGVVVERVAREGKWARVVLRRGNEAHEERFDRVLGLVGYKPDRALWEELQVHECWATGAPMKLAAALLWDEDGVRPRQTSRGPSVLENPEPRFVVIGAKSYGRSSQFLLRIGHDQVRDALTLLGKPE